ncbi:hypothetical protein AVEN_179913-1 [Araneus ventricosus]|uniref:Uncharacterized protein n=1 Tax=Araneus ventricosus TaxID=182803 RepID=A0A4Y2LBD4_ARAVE|nr:hypothetical protein AVEN_179913-1 [Araneus ventricosus]
MIFAVRVDIDVYDASGNIVHIAGKSQFPMLRKKRQYKHRNGDDCVTSIFFDASEIGTVLNRRHKSYILKAEGKQTYVSMSGYLLTNRRKEKRAEGTKRWGIIQGIHFNH